jgi:hypothetical protein
MGIIAAKSISQDQQFLNTSLAALLYKNRAYYTAATIGNEILTNRPDYITALKVT